MGTMAAADHKPHAVLVPYPAQGHIRPMLELAKLLHFHGFHITFVNTEYNHNRLLKSNTGLSVAAVLDDFRFETIPDGLPPCEHDGTQDVPSLCDSTTKNFLAPFREVLLRLNGSSSLPVPPVTCIIGDGIMSFTADAASGFGIPVVLFWTPSACGFMAYLHYQHLVDLGLIPLKDAADLNNGYLDKPIDWLPSMKNLRLRDFPSFIRTSDPKDIMLNFFIRETSRASMGSAIILNTFDDLERPVLDAMARILPPLYTIGSISLLSRRNIPESPLSLIGSSLWKEDSGCMEWLEMREPRSVVYVNFGSITVMSSEQVIEFAWGLANSNHDFLWVIRPDLVRGDSAVLPAEFSAETEGRGRIASWCAQEEVLSHAAVGGFFTHCGWNSTMESICGGVPMLCWPFFAEQQTNCRYACTEWGIGIEVDKDARREEVERLIRELMGGEKGREMRRRALEWKESAGRAAQPGGSSAVNFDRLLKGLLTALPNKARENE